MVGVLVIAIIAAVIAIAVFAVIPWVQDEAAKQSLTAVRTAEGVHFVQSSPDGLGRYVDDEGLEENDLIPDAGDDLEVYTDTDGTCYVGVSTSQTGNQFFITNRNPTPAKVVDAFGNGCVSIPVPGGTDPIAAACTDPATDETTLLAAFNGAVDGTVVCIENDISATAASAAFGVAVPHDVNMTVNLQGHILTLANGANGLAALGVRDGTSLLIADTVGGGVLTATTTPGVDPEWGDPDGNTEAAAIGGNSATAGVGTRSGDLVFNNVTVNALGASGSAASIGGGGAPYIDDNYVGADSGPITFIDSTINAAPTDGSGRGMGIGSGYQGAAGPIVIQHSTVSAFASNGSAIGAAYGGKFSSISILDGSVVNALSTSSGAAIGSASSNGRSSGAITISASEVTADGSYNTGIGGAYSSAVGDITIDKSDVTAKGSATGIGQGPYVSGIGGSIAITSSKVTSDSQNGTAIGNASSSTLDDITIIDSEVTANGSSGGINAGGQDGAGSENIEIRGSTVNATAGDNGIGARYNTTMGDLTISDSQVTSTARYGSSVGVSYNGEVGDISVIKSTLTATSANGMAVGGGPNDSTVGAIVVDDSEVTANGSSGGVGVGQIGSVKSIEIKNGSTLIARVGWSGSGAGVGGGFDSTVGPIKIADSSVDVYAETGVGIGSYQSVESIDITRSVIVAVAASSSSAAAIGYGHDYDGFVHSIKISGSTVDATSNGAAGIGGGFNDGNDTGSNGVGSITLDSSTIRAQGGNNSSGIGGGTFGGQYETITVNSGDVTASGGENGAGIGSGYAGNSSNDGIFSPNGGKIAINGGTVTAVGGAKGAGIGGGWVSDSGAVVINGGTVTATAGAGADSIGHGYGGWQSETWDSATGSVITADHMEELNANVKLLGGTVTKN
jgi:hypothetical protein